MAPIPPYEVFLDVHCPYSRIAVSRLRQAAGSQVMVLPVPRLVNGDKLVGSAWMQGSAWRHYVEADATRTAQRFGQPLMFQSGWPLARISQLNEGITGLMHRAVASVNDRIEGGRPGELDLLRRDYGDWAYFTSQKDEPALRRAEVARGAPWAALETVFNAFWGSGESVAAPQFLRTLAAGLGIHYQTYLTPEVETEVADNERALTTALGFGTPTFVVGGEIFWGQERMEEAHEAWLASVRSG